MVKMRSAIIGCGDIAHVHAESIRKLYPEGLAAVCDIVPDRAEEMSSLYGAKAYYDLDTMLSEEAIDVLHICTPHYLHTPMTIQALERGVHVFMEKPPVINEEQWKELKLAVVRTEGKARLGLCFQNRFNKSVCYVKKKLENGTYGKILGARGLVTWSRDAQYYENSSWKGSWEKEGGGALINQSVHTLDLLQYLIDQKPVSIKTVMDNQHLPGIIQVEDTVASYITYQDSRACFYAANSYAADVPPLIELECEKARVRIEDRTVTVWAQGKEKRELIFKEQDCTGKSYWGSGHLQCIHSFYESVEKGTKFSMDLPSMENTIWLLLKSYEIAEKPV